MSFAGKVWRLLVGIKDALVLILMLLFFSALYAALSASPYKDSAREGALVIALSGAIVEQPAEASPIDALAGSIAREHRLAEIVHALDTAATDDRVKAVALDLDIFTGGGQAAIADVGDALDRVRRAGKTVVAYAAGYSYDSYQLAAHADEIWLDPIGAVVVAGPGGSNLYYAGLMERLGVTANVYRVGTYKSAVEPYTRSGMSPEARSATQAVADSLWESWLEDVGQARADSRIADWVRDPMPFVRAANGDLARAALDAGLVDHVGDRTAFGRRMAELAGRDRSGLPGAFRTISYDAYVSDNPVSRPGGRIGVLTIAGTITDGRASAGTAGAETIVENLERGLRQHRLAALVVRVDSPGGSVTGSERIRRAIQAVRARGIPVVVSFGSVAASGGYWIATAGDTILAEPATITGSIGVFAVLPSFEEALRRIGVGADGVRTTPLSGQPDLLGGISGEADALLQTGVDATYARFVALVSQARELPVARVNEIGQGRVWDGGTARQLGLVDSFGSLPEAIAEAARRAEIEGSAAQPVFLEKAPGFLATMLAGLGGAEAPAVSRDAFARLGTRPQAAMARALADVETMLAGPAIQARCLECPVVGAPPPARRANESLIARLIAFLQPA